ncbi:COMPASS (complex proteins associated with Set1p) component [Lithohypha guttulata]|uniref:COMPASS (Complex proteins associated with Set1p) component n=1 Tax=Lithohypha guttulata TaxID=1690604 RepID=A0AAN7T5S5_9EURO|nr:COMPASS (complex proteins associated with Set1p) component [Lithohypha guttulata]
MSAFSVSDLLNPAPASRPASPGMQDTLMHDDPSTTIAGDMFAPELFHTDSMLDGPSIFDQQGMIPLEQSSSPEFLRKDSVISDILNGADTLMEDIDLSIDAKKKDKTPRQRETEKPKDTRHSSKNEGQHTDRRYLCYICHKLFTRRRSVRDHLNKIHGEKTWEPQKSLEVVVEPHSGEPIEPIEDIIARGPPPPPKSVKTSKPSKDEASSKQPSEEKEPEDRVGGDEEEDAPLILQTQKSLHDANDLPESLIAPESLIQFEPEPDSNETRPETVEVETESKTEPEIQSIIPPAQPPKIKKEESQRSESRPVSVEPIQSIPAPLIGKKRPLAMTKKGTAKVKSATPSKRLKMTEPDRTPTRSPSVTPAQKTGSKLKKIANIASPASRASSRQPSPSPTPSGATPASSNDDGEVFCICRKGDNHTWMIACDGPCQEWYHGKCIGIRERDGELIDKFFCPYCAEKGLTTTWKRMCRRSDCRKPARVKDNPPSKYCSVECGRMFFVDLLRRGDPDAHASKDGQFIVEKQKAKKVRKKIRRNRPVVAHVNSTGTPVTAGSRPHTPAYSDEEKSEYETDTSLDDDELSNRGGPLRAGEVKALLQQCRNVASWRELGKRIDNTPPRDMDEKEQKVVFDDFEQARMRTIKEELAELGNKLTALAEREKFLELIKSRSQTIADDIKKNNPKMKSACGYDPRCAWNDAEFLQWYESGGKEIMAGGKIGPPDDDARTVDGIDNSEDDEKAATMKGGVCVRSSCTKHGRTWQKSQLAELRFEQDLIKKKQDNLMQQEQRIRSRAQIRGLELQGPTIVS